MPFVYVPKKYNFRETALTEVSDDSMLKKSNTMSNCRTFTPLKIVDFTLNRIKTIKLTSVIT